MPKFTGAFGFRYEPAPSAVDMITAFHLAIKSSMVVSTLGTGCGASQDCSLPSYSQAYVAIPLLKASASLFSMPNKASRNAKVPA